MSCHLHVYVGAAAAVESEPDSKDFDPVYDLTEGRLYSVYNGDENRLPYLLPNLNSTKYGATFVRDADEPEPFAVTPELIADRVNAFYEDYREDLFRLSDAGFSLKVQYVVLSYWL